MAGCLPISRRVPSAGQNPTGLLTQPALFNRERESLGERKGRLVAMRRFRAIFRKLSRGEASP